MGNYHVVLGDYDRGSVDGGEQMIKVLNIHIVSITIDSGLLYFLRPYVLLPCLKESICHAKVVSVECSSLLLHRFGG